MIPSHLLSKMGKYDIEVEAGVKVKANVIDHHDLIDRNISELRSLLGEHCVVGMDVKMYQREAQMIVFCVGNRCLIIQLCHLRSHPESLKNFLGDESICFVGTGMEDKVSKIRYATDYNMTCYTGVEMGHLAARIFKNPELTCFKLTMLAMMVGIELGSDGAAMARSLSSSNRRIPAAAGTCPADWTARVFTHEEIKYAINDAYAFYAIGSKLLDSLDGSDKDHDGWKEQEAT